MKVEMELTEKMMKAHENCSEDTCGECPCLLGEDDCLFYYVEKILSKSEAITEFAVAVLADIAEYAKQEDAPVYEGDKEVDNFVRLSDVNEVINKHLN